MAQQNPVPNPASGAETGAPNSYWINSVRDRVGDRPYWQREQMSGDSVNGVVGAGSVPFRVSNPPIYDEASTNPTSINCAIGGSAQTPIVTGTPTAGQVLVDFNSGELTFSAAPTTGSNNIAVSYQHVAFTDAMVLDALYAGLRAMWPKVGKVYADSEAVINVNTWDYDVPAWAQEPHSEIFGVEIQETGVPTNPYKPLAIWDRVGPTKLQIPGSQAMSISSRIRISGVGPYMRLGDLEPSLYNLPIFYACGYLAAQLELRRLRDDRQPAFSQEATHQPGQMTALSTMYFRQFDRECDRMKHVPTGWKKHIVTTYQRQAY